MFQIQPFKTTRENLVFVRKYSEGSIYALYLCMSYKVRSCCYCTKATQAINDQPFLQGRDLTFFSDAALWLLQW